MAEEEIEDEDSESQNTEQTQPLIGAYESPRYAARIKLILSKPFFPEEWDKVHGITEKRRTKITDPEKITLSQSLRSLYTALFTRLGKLDKTKRTEFTTKLWGNGMREEASAYLAQGKNLEETRALLWKGVCDKLNIQ